MEKLKLFQWYDELIVAHDEADARRLLKEQRNYDGRSLRPYPIKQARRSVELVTLSTDEVHSYKPSEVIQMHGRGVIRSV